MHRLLPIAAAAAAMPAACSMPMQPPPSQAAAAQLAGRIAGAPESCVSTEPTDSLHALDAQTIAYGSGRTVYVNRLPAACPGIRPMSTLITEVYGSRLCRGDRVRGLEQGSTIPGPACILGDWVPYRRP